jgi:hypothetical protein
MDHPVNLECASASCFEVPRAQLVRVAPRPGFARLDRSNERMRLVLIMLARMPLRRGIAAADMSAGEAHPQVKPCVTGEDAVLAVILVGLGHLDIADVNARSHAFLLVKGGRDILRTSWQWYRQGSGNARRGRPRPLRIGTVTGAAARLQCREFGAVVDVPIPKAAP